MPPKANAEMRVVQIVLKTDLKDMKESVEKANEEKGYVEVNINTEITWFQLFLNWDVQMKPDFVIKNDSGDITSQLTDSVASYIRKFKIARNKYPAKIMKKTLPKSNPGKQSGKAKELPRSPKRGGANTTSEEPAGKRGRGRPRSTTPKAPVARKKLPTKKAAPIRIPATPTSLPTRDNNNSSGVEEVVLNGSPPLPNGFANGFQNRVADPDRVDVESQFSFAMPNVPPGAAHPNSDVKAAVIESIIKNVSNSMLWRIKEEYDGFRSQGNWLRLAQHIPQLGNLVTEMFSDEHFKKFKKP